jgi:hypothetical protein
MEKRSKDVIFARESVLLFLYGDTNKKGIG